MDRQHGKRHGGQTPGQHTAGDPRPEDRDSDGADGERGHDLPNAQFEPIGNAGDGGQRHPRGRSGQHQGGAVARVAWRGRRLGAGSPGFPELPGEASQNDHQRNRAPVPAVAQISRMKLCGSRISSLAWGSMYWV